MHYIYILWWESETCFGQFGIANHNGSKGLKDAFMFQVLLPHDCHGNMPDLGCWRIRRVEKSGVVLVTPDKAILDQPAAS